MEREDVSFELVLDDGESSFEKPDPGVILELQENVVFQVTKQGKLLLCDRCDRYE